MHRSLPETFCRHRWATIVVVAACLTGGGCASGGNSGLANFKSKSKVDKSANDSIPAAADVGLAMNKPSANKR
jgi:hypothetical protein